MLISSAITRELVVAMRDISIADLMLAGSCAGRREPPHVYKETSGNVPLSA